MCLLKDWDCFRGEWRLSRVVDVFPDRFGNVRNVEVMVKPTQDGCPRYHPSGGQKLRRHVSNLVVLVPAEDQVTEDTPVRGLDVGELHQAEDYASGVLRSSGGTVSTVCRCYWLDLNFILVFISSLYKNWSQKKIECLRQPNLIQNGAM